MNRAKESRRERRALAINAKVALAVFLPLIAVYSLTAQWTVPYHIDPLTNAITGWYLASDGTVIASQHEVLARAEHHGNLGWFLESPRGTVSQYPPGSALWAAVAYSLADVDTQEISMVGTNRPDLDRVPVSVPALWPATLSAVIATALTASILAVIFRNMSGNAVSAVGAGLAFGLATTAWSVASSMSWTHAPAMLAVSVGILAVQRDRWIVAGLPLSFAILTRPHLAVVSAIVGLGVSAHRRNWKPCIQLGLSSSIGVAALLVYNGWVWGAPSISGGYGSGFTDQFVGSSFSWFLSNVWGALFDPTHGLLTWAPFLIVLATGAVAARKHQSDWASWAALGGLVYLIIQLRANRFSGGAGHFAYRYPLEMLVAISPWLYIGYCRWVSPRLIMRLALWVCLAIGVLAQIFGISLLT